MLQKKKNQAPVFIEIRYSDDDDHDDGERHQQKQEKKNRSNELKLNHPSAFNPPLSAHAYRNPKNENSNSYNSNVKAKRQNVGTGPSQPQKREGKSTSKSTYSTSNVVTKLQAFPIHHQNNIDKKEVLEDEYDPSVWKLETAFRRSLAPFKQKNDDGDGRPAATKTSWDEAINVDDYGDDDGDFQEQRPAQSPQTISSAVSLRPRTDRQRYDLLSDLGTFYETSKPRTPRAKRLPKASSRGKKSAVERQPSASTGSSGVPKSRHVTGSASTGPKQNQQQTRLSELIQEEKGMKPGPLSKRRD